MDVSIILVSYNTRELTKSCIKSIYEKTEGLNFDIWVVDNASKDGSCEMIKKEFPEVKLIESQENLGFGRANNLAIRQTDAKYVFLLNTDTVLVNNAIKILFDFMEKSENLSIGACGGQLYNEDMSYQGSSGNFDNMNLKYLFKKSLGLNWTSRIERLKYIFRRDVLKKGFVEKETEWGAYHVDFIIGADLMIRKSVLDRVGAFDERFFMFSEEAELCFRIKKSGFKNVIVSEAKIVHFGGGTINKNNTSIEVEKMRVEGNILFYEICHGKEIARIAKFLYLIYYVRYFFLRFFSPKSFARVRMALSLIK